MTDKTLCVDIAIVGAGLVGLSAAVALQLAGFSVVLIDSKSPTNDSQNDHELDNRIYAISPKNAKWLHSLGVWQRLDLARICEMQAMEIFSDAAPLPLSLLAEDASADNLGFILEARALMQALVKQVEALGILTLFDGPCNKITSHPSKTVLHLDNEKVIESSLLLAADGSHSWVRRQLNMAMQQKPYDQAAIVANFEVEKSHANIARQWFRQEADGNNSILAWLPLPDNRVSIVWSVSTQYASTLLMLNDDEFVSQVQLAGSSLLGEMKLISPVASFPLTLQKAHAIVQDSVVLVGDAAHQIHPMAGQGVNLGFRDVIDLLAILEEKSQYQVINDNSLLKRYTRVRKADVMNMLLLTDSLYQLFESRNSIIKKVRNWGLAATKQHSLKKMLVAKAIAL